MNAEEQLLGYERLREMHDGETIFVAESVAFACDADSSVFGSLATLVFKDIDGREITVVLPFGFTEALTAKGYQTFIQQKPEPKTEKGYQKFAEKFRLYLRPGASDEFIREIYNSEHQGLWLIKSNLQIADKIADATLSADVLDAGENK